MIASGRQTAPPQHEVVQVTFLGCFSLLGARFRGFESLCSAPLLTFLDSVRAGLRAEVDFYLAVTAFASAAQAPPGLSSPAVASA